LAESNEFVFSSPYPSFSDSRNIKLSDALGEVWYGSGLLAGLILLSISLTILFMAVSNSWWKAGKALFIDHLDQRHLPIDVKIVPVIWQPETPGLT
jgi:hypothetical protein